MLDFNSSKVIMFVVIVTMVITPGHVFGTVIVAKPLREFARFTWWMQTKPNNIHIHNCHLVTITQSASWKLEGWVTLGTAVRVCSPWPRLYNITMAVVTSTQLPMVRFKPRLSHIAVKCTTSRPHLDASKVLQFVSLQMSVYSLLMFIMVRNIHCVSKKCALLFFE